MDSHGLPQTMSLRFRGYALPAFYDIASGFVKKIVTAVTDQDDHKDEPGRARAAFVLCAPGPAASHPASLLLHRSVMPSIATVYSFLSASYFTLYCVG